MKPTNPETYYSVDTRYELNPKRLIKVAPDSPGVYLFEDSSGKVIYAGKAKNLKKRILSYFRSSAELPEKTVLMMKRAFRLNFILTATEKEAFILESNLIKKHTPRYNIIFRDDKNYPCLRLGVKETYPSLRMVRKIKKDGAIYFGPFSSAYSARGTHRVIDRVFQLRKCRGTGSLPKRTRPCINFQMNRCLGPCTKDISLSRYWEIVQQVRLFLEGRNLELVNELKKEMAEAVAGLDFEKAAEKRDQIRAIEKTVERQHVISPQLEDLDVIGLARIEALFQVVILFIRKGHMEGSQNYFLKDSGGSANEVLEAFLKQYYMRDAFIPDKILISRPIQDLQSISDWFCDLAGKKVLIHRPQRGDRLRLIKMALANAENILRDRVEFQKEDLMKAVQTVLNLKKVPLSIEGIDISNLHGNMAVGAVVSFVDGLPNKSGYRNYKIKAMDGIDDYGMMAQLVERRIAGDDLPDLFLVDGGKGHLSVVKRTLEHNAGAEVISIAKPDEDRKEKCDKIYIVNRKNPVLLRSDHPVLLLMMRIRDEAHRRAITYHRKLRGKVFIESELDFIPGIGVKRKKNLLKHFKDIHAISKASMDELAEVEGINRSLAEKIFDHL